LKPLLSRAIASIDCSISHAGGARAAAASSHTAAAPAAAPAAAGCRLPSIWRISGCSSPDSAPDCWSAGKSSCPSSSPTASKTYSLSSTGLVLGATGAVERNPDGAGLMRVRVNKRVLSLAIEAAGKLVVAEA
jgi:hypothetical protein